MIGNDKVFVIHIAVGAVPASAAGPPVEQAFIWVPLTPMAVTQWKPPYAFSSAADAWRMADICYPDHCRMMRLGGEELVRVTAMTPSRYRELFSLHPTTEIPETIGV